MYDLDGTKQKLFGLTDNEVLFNKVSHSRLLELIDNPDTQIYNAKVDYNNYGEYLFITLVKKDLVLTFYGLGYHEHSEKWITNTWEYYESRLYSNAVNTPLSVIQTSIAIQERLQEITPHIEPCKRSEHALLFDAIAELTDSDFAYSELED